MLTLKHGPQKNIFLKTINLPIYYIIYLKLIKSYNLTKKDLVFNCSIIFICTEKCSKHTHSIFFI